MGRPPLENPRSKMVNTRMTQREYALVAEAAEASGLRVAEYVRVKALAAAKRAAR